MATFKGKQNCDCAICSKQQGFEVGTELLDDLLGGKVTLFVGAGVSTESKNVYKETFLERRAAELGIDPKIGFPAVMQRYCAQTNGRMKLLQEIRTHFEHIDSFPEMHREARKFHRELGTFHPVRNIITTNWDTYFERFCMATPFVVDPDLAFWEAADRRVLKLHGSVTNFGSIVATEADYTACAKRLHKGMIGALLKTLLATQTVIFIGYSLTDSDFKVIYDFVRKQMMTLHRQSYVITPFADEAETFKLAGLIPIVTDGTYFVEQIKKHAVQCDAMLDDEVFDAAWEFFDLVDHEHQRLHARLKPSKFPQIMYAAAYQDGLMHALERAAAMRGSGKYSRPHEFHLKIQSYLEWQRAKLRRGNYEDVAYIEGYVNGLLFMLMRPKERKGIPLYYAFGAKEELCSFNQYLSFLRRTPDAHKASLKRAVRKYSELSDPDSMVIHHPPWL